MDVNIFWKYLLIIGSMLVALASSVGLIKWQHDNQIEQMAEKFIESQTGWDIDLSPEEIFVTRGLDMVSTPASFSIDDEEIAGI